MGGLGQCLRAEKTRSQKNARKWRRIPHVGCTPCWAVFDLKTRSHYRAISGNSRAVREWQSRCPVAADVSYLARRAHYLTNAAPVSAQLAEGRMPLDHLLRTGMDYLAGWLSISGGASEIEHDAWHIANYPSVVSGRNNSHIAWAKLGSGAVVHPNDHSS